MIESEDGSGKSLVEHWNWASSKGLMNRNTAGALRAACAQVLSVEESWESLDVRTIDAEDLFSRFANLRKQDFTPTSLQTYRSRFKKALNMYLAYLDDPANWRPEARRPQQRTTKRGESSGSREKSQQAAEADSGLVTYPFPVRQGVMGELRLPADLRRTEARRIAAFVETLASEDLALPAPPIED